MQQSINNLKMAEFYRNGYYSFIFINIMDVLLQHFIHYIIFDLTCFHSISLTEQSFLFLLIHS